MEWKARQQIMEKMLAMNQGDPVFELELWISRELGTFCCAQALAYRKEGTFNLHALRD